MSRNDFFRTKPGIQTAPEGAVNHGEQGQGSGQRAGGAEPAIPAPLDKFSLEAGEQSSQRKDDESNHDQPERDS